MDLGWITGTLLLIMVVSLSLTALMSPECKAAVQAQMGGDGDDEEDEEDDC